MSGVITEVLMSLGLQITELDSQMWEHHFSGLFLCKNVILHSGVITEVLMSLGLQITELDSQMWEHHFSGLFLCKNVILHPLKVLLIVCVATARYMCWGYN